MESIKLKSHVGDDGVLQIQVPVGFKNEDLEVMVIFQRLKSRDRHLANLNRFFSQFISLPFDDNAAAIAGQVRAQLDVAGTPIGSNDLLIAAIALSNDFTLVTHNTREFGRINGLKYEPTFRRSDSDYQDF